VLVTLFFLSASDPRFLSHTGLKKAQRVKNSDTQKKSRARESSKERKEGVSDLSFISLSLVFLSRIV
jgi:hypothetical protein